MANNDFNTNEETFHFMDVRGWLGQMLARDEVAGDTLAWRCGDVWTFGPTQPVDADDGIFVCEGTVSEVLARCP